MGVMQWTGENRPLVMDTPVEFEKQPVEQLNPHFRGILRICFKLMKENWKKSTWNQWELETLGSWPIMPKTMWMMMQISLKYEHICLKFWRVSFVKSPLVIPSIENTRDSFLFFSFLILVSQFNNLKMSIANGVCWNRKSWVMGLIRVGSRPMMLGESCALPVCDSQRRFLSYVV